MAFDTIDVCDGSTIQPYRGTKIRGEGVRLPVFNVYMFEKSVKGAEIILAVGSEKVRAGPAG